MSFSEDVDKIAENVWLDGDVSDNITNTRPRRALPVPLIRGTRLLDVSETPFGGVNYSNIRQRDSGSLKCRPNQTQMASCELPKTTCSLRQSSRSRLPPHLTMSSVPLPDITKSGKVLLEGASKMEGRSMDIAHGELPQWMLSVRGTKKIATLPTSQAQTKIAASNDVFHAGSAEMTAMDEAEGDGKLESKNSSNGEGTGDSVTASQSYMQPQDSPSATLKTKSRSSVGCLNRSDPKEDPRTIFPPANILPISTKNHHVVHQAQRALSDQTTPSTLSHQIIDTTEKAEESATVISAIPIDLAPSDRYALDRRQDLTVQRFPESQDPPIDSGTDTHIELLLGTTRKPIPASYTRLGNSYNKSNISSRSQITGDDIIQLTPSTRFPPSPQTSQSVFSISHQLRSLSPDDPMPKPDLFRLNLNARKLHPRASTDRNSPITRSSETTTEDITAPTCERTDQAGSKLLENSGSVTASPKSVEDAESDDGSDFEYETPVTSPDNSPQKFLRSNEHRLAPLPVRFLQIDGARSVEEEEAATVPADADAVSADESTNVPSDGDDAAGHRQTGTDWSSTTLTDYADYDDVTPLLTAASVKPASFLSSSSQPTTSSALELSKRTRPPSAYLQFNQRKRPTSQQIRLNRSGIDSSDRFLPNRTHTPTKDALMLQRPKAKKFSLQSALGSYVPESDPFGPTPRRSLRMAEQYATIRSPLTPSRPTMRNGTIVPDTRPFDQRADGTGTIWNVGGIVVTEGVPSVTNSRGGRVTSGSNAAHYSADFLRKNSPSEEEAIHSRRLAVAMDVSPTDRMMHHSALSSHHSPFSASSGSPARRRVFRDGAWEVDGPPTPTRQNAKKTKDISVIPFRVLDAPALRDDYYCSLLAYSATLECLVVGLGSHVYLWTENKSRQNIPDSLSSGSGSGYVTSLSFSSTEGGSAILATGRSEGRVTLWSPLDREPRFDSEQPAPVSCVAFRPKPVRRPSIRDSNVTVLTEELLVGDEAGSVYYYSIEWPNEDQRDLFNWHGSMTLLARISCHTQQVCGIAWSGEGEYFATGGNDNKLYLFDTRHLLKRASSASVTSQRQNRPTDSHQTSPINVSINIDTDSGTLPSVAGQGPILTITLQHAKHTFTLNAAVKAIAFAPWQPSLLAAGGGSNDRCIHFFHAASGARLATVDCYAQVTSLVWSSRRKEIAATFGFAQPEHAYRIAVFGWPSGDLRVAIPWFSEERALYAVPYPRGPTTRRGPTSTAGTGAGGSGGDAASARSRGGGARPGDAEGRPWSGRRTCEEGCLVVATSDASIKFHEIWAERADVDERGKRMMGGEAGRTFAGSQILEGECSGELERRETIR